MSLDVMVYIFIACVIYVFILLNEGNILIDCDIEFCGLPF